MDKSDVGEASSPTKKVSIKILAPFSYVSCECWSEREIGSEAGTGRHARVTMSADDTRRHTCARARARALFTERNCRTGYPVMRIATWC